MWDGGAQADGDQERAEHRRGVRALAQQTLELGRLSVLDGLTLTNDDIRLFTVDHAQSGATVIAKHPICGQLGVQAPQTTTS